ncbi:MAG: alpha-amylase family glycosyl hydrolase, partial [bacterium]
METSRNKNFKRPFALILVFFFVFITLFSFSACQPASENEKPVIESEDSGVDLEVSEERGPAVASYKDPNWVKGTNIYEIFVNRFGTNLQGVTQKIDYLEKLGIKTIWLMPIFTAMNDHGYDTINYYDIDSRYGTIDGLKSLVEAAHDKGIMIILDLVMNHCGTKHPWFSSPNDSERKDNWFIWAGSDLGWPDSWEDQKAGYFPSATWFQDPYRSLDRDHNGNQNDDDYYFSLFGDSGGATMPDLNFNDTNSKAEILNEFENIMKFWIQKTDVDGFRCDAVRYLVENGKGKQKDQPETHSIWKDLRSRLARIKPGAILLAEAPTETADQMIEYYGNGDEFHTAFHFNLQGRLMNCLKNERRPSDLLKELYAIQGRLPEGTQDTIFLSNHDRFAGDRVATQLNGNTAKIKGIASLYLLLSGNPAIYYGEEIGMANGPGNYDEPVRQPMDWDEVQKQEDDPDSTLNHYVRLLKLRNNYDALREGITYFVPTHSNDGWDGMYSESKTLSIIREFYGEKILVTHNFSSNNQTVHVNLNESGLTFPPGTEAHAIMSGGNYAPVSDSNKTYYSLGTVYGFTTRAIFLGDISRYKDPNGKYLTYENIFPDSWYFRGTPNNWEATLMELNDQGLWTTVQTFGGDNPRFKISHYKDNWNEAY